MARKFKEFGLVFIAASALGIIASAAAQAAQLHATTQGQEQQFVIHGEQIGGAQIVLTTNAGTVKCTQATFEGTSAPTAAEATITLTIAGCQAFGVGPTMDMNGCKLTLTSTDTIGVTYGSKTFNWDVAGCTSGKVIEITSPICRMTVPEQSHIQHMVFSNVAGQPHDVEGDITGTGIKYQADGPLCPNMPTGQTQSNGILSGKGTFQAYKSLGTNQVTKHTHQYNEHQRGTSLGLQVT